MERLKTLCGLWRSTVKRWQRYFRDLFPHSSGYRRFTGRLLPPMDPDHLPGALLARFCQGEADCESALIGCLRALALGPWRTRSFVKPVIGLGFTQKMGGCYQNGKQEVFWGQLESRLLEMLRGLENLKLSFVNEAA